jgi:hypothetical protein
VRAHGGADLAAEPAPEHRHDLAEEGPGPA